jgi:hypothetical protein
MTTPSLQALWANVARVCLLIAKTPALLPSQATTHHAAVGCLLLGNSPWAFYEVDALTNRLPDNDLKI